MSALLTGALLLPSVASADLVLGINAPTLTGNSADNKSGSNGTTMLENLSSIAVPDGGGSVVDGVGNSVDGIIRYAAVALADRDSNGGGINRSANNAWQVSFTVDAPLGTTFDLQIDTSRLGALTNVSDSGNAVGVGSAELRALTGTYSGPGTVSGSLNLAAQGFTLELNNRNDAINQATTLFATGIAGTGVPQLFTLTFASSMRVESTGGIGFPINTSSDDAAVRLGMASTYPTANTTAGSYPGPGGRNMADDGHFVNIKATMTVVPEPSTWIMAVMAGIGLVALRRRKAA